MAKKKEMKPMMAEGPKKDDDWEADSAVDTLMRAHEIRSNKELMKRVKKRSGKKLAALEGLKKEIKSLDDLKELADEYEEDEA